jgi:hypothetical protein
MDGLREYNPSAIDCRQLTGQAYCTERRPKVTPSRLLIIEGEARHVGILCITLPVITKGVELDWTKLTDQERLVAEQAVLTYRALEQAAEAAPVGKGMEMLERAIHDKGFEHLRTMLQAAASARPEAQKKGPASGPVSAAETGSSSG